MPETIRSRIKRAWNAFSANGRREDQNFQNGSSGAVVSYIRPDRPRFTRGNERSIVTSVLNRIAMDVASLTFNHVRLDDDKRFESIIESGINNCLTLDANIDQTGRAFIQDVVMSMLDEGCVALVPVDTTLDPTRTGGFDIETMRTGKVLEWYPRKVKIRAYNDRTGEYEDIMLPKSSVAIIENPLYAVMNEPNSTMQRLMRKLSLMDTVDENNSSAKLDLIIQVPYAVKGDLKIKRANKRLDSIKQQLTENDYGIAYIDGTEKVIQLNRPVESNLLKQVDYLTNLLYSQLGISQGVMEGTADEQQMLNYNNRTIEPIASAIADEMKRKFLTKTARTQGQSIMFFHDPFKLVPVEQMSEIADKFTRNEIMSSNEIRQVIGMKPSKDPKADELRNANISEPAMDRQVPTPTVTEEDENQNGGV